MKRLTIIVPIYNVQNYLKECLDSFVDQTSKEFQVLLIDDGSTDKSSIIAKDYEQKHPELFKYVRQENKGLGGARNTGLSMVETDYLMFFDSDDFMANRAVENVINHVKNYQTDIIFFNPVIYDVSLNCYCPWHDRDLMKKIFEKNKVINPSKTPELMLSEASVCRAIWKTEFFKKINLRFMEHIHWEDVPPHFLVMHNAQSASFMDYEGAYFYRANTGNQITSGNGKTRLDMKVIFETIAPHFSDKTWTHKEKIHMLGFISNYVLWSMRVIDDDYLPQFVDITHSFLKRISYFGLFSGFYFKCHVGIKSKLLIFMLKNGYLAKKLKNRDYINDKINFLKRVKRIIKK